MRYMTGKDSDEWGFDTHCVHAGQEEPDPETGARAPPIYQTTSYVFDDADRAADLYALKAEGNVYSRFNNPTVSMLERRLARLESGTAAVATGSGMAALDAATSVLASTGDNIVSAASIYGGTHSYYTNMLTRRGIEPRFVDTLDPHAYAEAIDENTAYVHFETIGNPSLVTPDFEAIAEVAHDRGVPVFVDNTFGTPALCRPLEHGADLIWESTTKWIHGSGTTVVSRRGRRVSLDGLPRAVSRDRRRKPCLRRHHIRQSIPRPAGDDRCPPTSGSKHRQRPGTIRRMGDHAGHRDALAADGATL
jgi:O-acetylhomoserine (thiol)-lyase